MKNLLGQSPMQILFYVGGGGGGGGGGGVGVDGNLQTFPPCSPFTTAALSSL